MTGIEGNDDVTVVTFYSVDNAARPVKRGGVIGGSLGRRNISALVLRRWISLMKSKSSYHHFPDMLLNVLDLGCGHFMSLELQARLGLLVLVFGCLRSDSMR